MPRLGQLVFYTSKGHPWVGINISAFVCVFFSRRFRITAVANNTTGWVTESLALNEYFLHHLGIWIADWFDTIVTFQTSFGIVTSAGFLRVDAGRNQQSHTKRDNSVREQHNNPFRFWRTTYIYIISYLIFWLYHFVILQLFRWPRRVQVVAVSASSGMLNTKKKHTHKRKLVGVLHIEEI